jgi:hypothetical protein
MSDEIDTEEDTQHEQPVGDDGQASPPTPPDSGEGTGAEDQDDPPANQEEESRTQKLLRLNLANLKKKVIRGGVLSAREIEMLKAEESGTDRDGAPVSGARFVKNQVELASALGVDRKTIYRWFQEEGIPETRSDGRYSVNEWREWAENTGRKISPDSINSGNERARNILLQNEILVFRLAVLRRDYVPMAEVEAVGSKLAVNLRKVIGTLHLLAPSLESVTAAEAEGLLKDKEDEMVNQLRVVASDLAKMAKPTSEEVTAVDGG